MLISVSRTRRVNSHSDTVRLKEGNKKQEGLNKIKHSLSIPLELAVLRFVYTAAVECY